MDRVLKETVVGFKCEMPPIKFAMLSLNATTATCKTLETSSEAKKTTGIEKDDIGTHK